jgi:2-polyprenyl-3-methyl-5-hydroxy-6-metoxy-1,4-benzoquinol methylase
MTLTYRQFRQVGSEQWIVQPDWFRKTFVRLAGPLGVNARIRNARVINSILRLHLPDEATILDAGCGHAYSIFWLARHFPHYHFTALELDPQLVQYGQEIAQVQGLEQVRFINGSVTEIVDVDAYDLIISVDVLEHISDDIDILNRFRKALHSEGHLILHLPRRHQEQHRFFGAFKNYITIDHVRDEYTADEISQKLNISSFSIEYLRYGFNMWGELAFELNYLFWPWKVFRILSALVFHPLSSWFAYKDICNDYEDGNSLIIIAKPVT